MVGSVNSYVKDCGIHRSCHLVLRIPLIKMPSVKKSLNVHVFEQGNMCALNPNLKTCLSYRELILFVM